MRIHGPTSSLYCLLIFWHYTRLCVSQTVYVVHWMCADRNFNFGKNDLFIAATGFKLAFGNCKHSCFRCFLSIGSC